MIATDDVIGKDNEEKCLLVKASNETFSHNEVGPLASLEYSQETEGSYSTDLPTPDDIRRLLELERVMGTSDHLPACLAHMLYCVVVEKQYNLAYFFAKRIKCARANPTANLPYGMFLTRLYRHIMEAYPHLDNGIYDIVDRVMRPLALKQIRRPRSDRGKARHSVSSSSSHYQGTSSHQHDDNNDGLIAIERSLDLLLSSIKSFLSANDNFSLNDDEELSLHDDASLDGSVPASNKGDAPAKPPQIITTNTLSNIKLPVLQKDDYDTWAMEMEHYLEYIDNEEEQFADEKERKARTLLLMAVPKDHLRRFHGMDDAKEIWAAIKTRFGGNANSKKMQKAVLKQQFEAFTISSKESLEKGSDQVRGKSRLQHEELIMLSWLSTVNNELIDCGMSSTVKIGLGYGIQSNAEQITTCRYKGVPHPLSGDYTPREQEDIDDSMYDDGELGIVSNASSTHYSTCQSNDSDGEIGAVSDHSVNDDSTNDHIAYYLLLRSYLATKRLNQSCLKYTQTVDLIGALMNIELKNGMDLGKAALKSKRVVHADVRQATPAWTNTNRVNKANHVLVLNFGIKIKSGASRFNTGKQHVNSGSVHVNSGTQIKSGASRFNTGKQHVNSRRRNACYSGRVKKTKIHPMKHSNGAIDECFVVSWSPSDFKMPDENQVLLKVPRQHNMYTFDMKNVVSSKGYTVRGLSLPRVSKMTTLLLGQKESKKRPPVAVIMLAIFNRKTHSPKQPSSTPISKSADDIMTFRKELDALALKHLGPVPATAPTSTNPVNTSSGIILDMVLEEVTMDNIEAILPRCGS
ncbi:hypothetical protein Tco_1262061 [Tanacetum coccineum]